MTLIEISSILCHCEKRSTCKVHLKVCMEVQGILFEVLGGERDST